MSENLQHRLPWKQRKTIKRDRVSERLNGSAQKPHKNQRCGCYNRNSPLASSACVFVAGRIPSTHKGFGRTFSSIKTSHRAWRSAPCSLSLSCKGLTFPCSQMSKRTKSFDSAETAARLKTEVSNKPWTLDVQSNHRTDHKNNYHVPTEHISLLGSSLLGCKVFMCHFSWGILKKKSLMVESDTQQFPGHHVRGHQWTFIDLTNAVIM